MVNARLLLTCDTAFYAIIGVSVFEVGLYSKKDRIIAKCTWQIDEGDFLINEREECITKGDVYHRRIINFV